MATILWTTAQYSDRPVELSATPMVITQAKCVGGDSSARALKTQTIPTVRDYDAAVKDHYNKGVQANVWVKLNALFEHVVDKCYAGDQNVFNSAHSGQKQTTPQFGSKVIRC